MSSNNATLFEKIVSAVYSHLTKAENKSVSENETEIPFCFLSKSMIWDTYAQKLS